MPTLKGGGAEKNTINIINSLDLKYYSPILIICGGKNNYSNLLSDKIRIILLNKKSVKHALMDIFKFLKKETPDIIFTTSNHLNVFLILYKKILGRKIISINRIPTLPSNNLSNNLKSKIVNKLGAYVYKYSDYVIAQSEQMRQEIIDIYKVQKSKVITIHNLINQEQISFLSKVEHQEFDNKNYNIICAGTLYSAKGFDLLIKALPYVIKQIPNVQLHILGDEGIEKGYKNYLQSLVIELELEKRITFYGFKPNPYPFIKNADLFALSSRKEGFPNVVLEALFLGTPVLATNCVNFDGIITNYDNGLVVSKNNIEALQNGIIECQELTKKNNLIVDNFNFNNWFAKVLEKNE